MRSQLLLTCNNPQITNEIKANLVKTNPDFLRLKKMGYPTHDISPTIKMYEDSGKGVLAPRCSLEMIRQVCAKHNERIVVKDNRTVSREIQVGLKDIQLFWYQEEAVNVMNKNQHGLIVAPCLVGNTIINVNRCGNGRQYTIKEMYDRFNGYDRYQWRRSEQTKVRSFDGERIISHPIRDVIYSGYEDVYTLTLENGNSITGTANHKIMTRDGWVELKDCTGKEVMCDTLLPVKTVEKSKRKGDKRVGGLKYHPFAREQGVGTSRYTKLVEYHRAVYEAHCNDMTLDEYTNILRVDQKRSESMWFMNPDEYHIHHRDGDHYNNDISNLELLSVEEHLKKHAVDYKFNFGQGVPHFSSCVSVTYTGKEDVYDIVCEEPYRNFVANGIVVHNCGSGKSIIGIAFIAKMKKPTMVIVHTLELFKQWEDEIKKHLYHEGELGRIGGGQRSLGNITIAMIQTLVKLSDKEWNAINNTFEIIIGDEAHHFGAESYMKLMKRNTAKYSLGLTATPKRRDGKNFIVSNYLGKVIYEITDRDLSVMGRSLSCQVRMVNTECKYNFTKLNENLAVLNTIIAKDTNRNNTIVSCIQQDVEDNRTIIVLTDRVIQGRLLNATLKSKGFQTDIIIGNISSDVRANIKNRMKTGNLQILIANKQIAAEGLDIPNIDSVHICFWTSNSSLIKQMIGRGRRATDDKDHCRVWFYTDKIMSVEIDETTFAEKLVEVPGFKHSTNRIRQWFLTQNFDVKSYDKYGEETM